MSSTAHTPGEGYSKEAAGQEVRTVAVRRVKGFAEVAHEQHAAAGAHVVRERRHRVQRVHVVPQLLLAARPRRLGACVRAFCCAAVRAAPLCTPLTPFVQDKAERLDVAHVKWLAGCVGGHQA